MGAGRSPGGVLALGIVTGQSRAADSATVAAPDNAALPNPQTTPATTSTREYVATARIYTVLWQLR